MHIINPGPVPTKTQIFGIRALPNEIRARMMSASMWHGICQAEVEIFDGSRAWINVEWTKVIRE